MGRKSKFRDDMRKIVGFVGYKADEVEQEPKPPIGAGRGIAWYSSSGAVASSGGTKGSDAPSLPTGVQDELESEAIGTSSSGRNSGGGGDVPEGDAPQVDSSTVDIANIGLSSGSVNQIGGLFDCTTGDAAVVTFNSGTIDSPLYTPPTGWETTTCWDEGEGIVEYPNSYYWQGTGPTACRFNGSSPGTLLAYANTLGPFFTPESAVATLNAIGSFEIYTDIVVTEFNVPCGAEVDFYGSYKVTTGIGTYSAGLKLDGPSGFEDTEQCCPPVEVDPAQTCLWPDTDPIQFSFNSDGTVTVNEKDANAPQEFKTDASEVNLCNGSGQSIQILPGINGGHVIRNTTTGINYYRDPTTGKLSYFDNTQLNNFTAPTYP